ncbi:hypothetical protein [Flavihumibacter solisilvae]|uniref:hypothetical protein n=1 Tax=Flavihumibacter solisilvae TaxID=1349421 RepID=UPI000B2E8DF2|nr:hypothetical protein [Flavihumibacter solisilvae]
MKTISTFRSGNVTEEHEPVKGDLNDNEDNTGCLGCLGYVLFLIVIFAILLLHSLV